MATTLYCPHPTCRAFIHPRQITNHLGTCPQCSKNVCILCRLPEHLPNKSCNAITIPDYVGIELQETFEEEALILDSQSKRMQEVFSRLIRNNAKAKRNVPGGLSALATKAYKDTLRVHHWDLVKEKLDVFRILHERKQALIEDHAKAMASRNSA